MKSSSELIILCKQCGVIIQKDKDGIRYLVCDDCWSKFIQKAT